MILKCIILLGIAISFFSNIESVFARDWAETVELLRAEVPYPVTLGSVCEHVARIELEEQYPAPKYSVEVGIEYSRDPFRPLGELDVVVFDQDSDKAVLIAEVKCWQNLGDAEHKAKIQRARFKNSLRRMKDLNFIQTVQPNFHYLQSQFDYEVPFILISQKGGELEGFDFTLEFTLDELQALRDTLSSSRKRPYDSPRYHPPIKRKRSNPFLIRSTS